MADYILTPVYDEASHSAIDSVADIHPVVLETIKANLPTADDSETLIFARQLETVKNRIYEKKYEKNKARTLVPFSNEKAEAGGSGTLVYRMHDHVTMAIVVGNYTTDFPLVSASAREFVVRYHHFGNAFGYSVFDLRDAAKAGVSLETRMADIARKGHEQAMEDECATGVPALGTFGLLNHPNVSLLSLPTGNWAAASGELILADLNYMVTAMWNTNLEQYVGDTLIMSTAAYRKLATTMVNSAAGTMTVLNAFKEMNPGISVSSWTKLSTAGATGTGRMVFYKRDAEVLEFEVGREFEIMEPERSGMYVKFPCVSSAAGLQVHLPFAIQYIDNQTL